MLKLFTQIRKHVFLTNLTSHLAYFHMQAYNTNIKIHTFFLYVMTILSSLNQLNHLQTLNHLFLTCRRRVTFWQHFNIL